MADIQGNITKGPVLYYLDQLSRSDASLSRLGMLLEALEQLQPTYRGLVDVFQQHLFPDYDPARLEALNNYLRRYWFDEAQGWWRSQQPIEPVFCQGLIKALQEAINNPITIAVEDPAQGKRQKALPIDSYWLVVGERFEMTICRSLQQVTLLILTPLPLTHSLEFGIKIRQYGLSDAIQLPLLQTRRDKVPLELLSKKGAWNETKSREYRRSRIALSPCACAIGPAIRDGAAQKSMENLGGEWWWR